MYYLFIGVTFNNKYHSLLVKHSLVSFKEGEQSDSFTCALHCSHTLGWTDKTESDPLQTPAEAGCLSAALLYVLGRFCFHHAVLCPAVPPTVK